MRVRDGPAAVRGDALRQKPLGADAREGGGGGAPSQKTCRSPSIPIPSRKEESWPSASVSLSYRSLLVLPATALAATVKVRVEGKTKTLFAPTEVTVTAANAQDALEQASLAGEFYYHVTVTGFGPYVDQVGRYGGTASSGWVFKVERRLAARRRRQGRAEGRRSRALVLRRRSGRPAARRRSPSRPRRRGATSRRPSTTTGRRRPSAGSSSTSARSARSRATGERRRLPRAAHRACSCARPRPARSARTR